MSLTLVTPMNRKGTNILSVRRNLITPQRNEGRGFCRFRIALVTLSAKPTRGYPIFGKSHNEETKYETHCKSASLASSRKLLGAATKIGARGGDTLAP